MARKASAIVACLALSVLTTYAQGGGRAGGQRQAPSTAGQPGNDAKSFRRSANGFVVAQ